MDLSGSVAKLARANEHFEALQREIKRVIEESSPHLAFFGEVDQTSGWCSLYIESLKDQAKESLGVIVGDFVNNLRCALDYVVSNLAGSVLKSRHQFPIYDDRDEYLREVGTETVAVHKGRLGGITKGLHEFWVLQPFHRGPDAVLDPLFCLNHFSNTDKHRLLVSGSTMPSGPGQATITTDGKVAEVIGTADLSTWLPDEKFEVSRIRFDTAARPPTQYHLKGNVAVEIFFVAPAFGKYLKGNDALAQRAFGTPRTRFQNRGHVQEVLRRHQVARFLRHLGL